MATLAHPAEGEFGNRSGTAGGMRRVLERAVDAAPGHIRPPRGRLRGLFARGRSARALIERYRLWPAIEHAYERITREYGPMRVEISAEDDGGDHYVLLEFYGDAPEGDERLEFESEVRRGVNGILGRPGRRRLHLFINRDVLHEQGR